MPVAATPRSLAKVAFLTVLFTRSANSRHSYSFPRIYGIMNDGTKSYDVGKDGQGQEIGACSVRFASRDGSA